MAFGQNAGPPATARQIEELRGLLEGAGHIDFRDARGPMGFNQRQANGKFTRDEAESLIAQLQSDCDTAAEAAAGGPTSSPEPKAEAPRRAQPKAARPAANLQRVSSAALAAELQLRGWIVVEP